MSTHILINNHQLSNFNNINEFSPSKMATRQVSEIKFNWIIKIAN